MNKQLHIKDLTTTQLWDLRKEIVLNSVFLSDYDNSLGIEPQEVCNFFDSWLEDLGTQMEEQIPNYCDSMFLDYLPDFDNYECLTKYFTSLD